VRSTVGFKRLVIRSDMSEFYVLSVEVMVFVVVVVSFSFFFFFLLILGICQCFALIPNG